MEHRHSQDWSGWAATAAPRTCQRCAREFQPNHPRRQNCGLPDCSDVAAALLGSQPQPTVRAREREHHLQGILGDALVHLNRPDAPEGTRQEVSAAMVELLEAEKSGRPVSPAVYTHLIAALTVRARVLMEDRSRG
jgi:hypothetical protein